jgi:DNA-binding response OmpR family regulator
MTVSGRRNRLCASDYLAKPVNTEQLLSALRMWLHR